jgi:uncharacterized protein
MRKSRDGQLVYSPTDLVRFYLSPFASWMDRHEVERPGTLQPDAESEEDRLIAEIGTRHERDHLQARHTAGTDVVEISRDEGAHAATVAALRAGCALAYQAALEFPPFAGYADFLEREEGTSAFGTYRYGVADTKLAAKEKPVYLLQLCAYAEMLAQIQGVRPEVVRLILRGGTVRPFRTDDFFFVYRSVKDAFLTAMAAFDPAKAPEPDVGGDWGRWSSEAQRRLEAADHIALVAGIRTDQVRRLRVHGIQTMAALAKASERVGGIGARSFERLRGQAEMQCASRGAAVPAWRVVPPLAEEPRRGLALLPPPSKGDVYFDMEGYPLVEGGLEYLFGAATDGEGEPEYRDWWAHDAAGERAAFTAFVRWATARRAADPSMHVYHYGAYERSALRRLMGRHAACEDEVDDFLRGEVLVDLSTVVRQGLRIGTSSYSLKDLEVLYRGERTGDVRSGGQSMVAYHRWTTSGEPPDASGSPTLGGIRAYNRDDCLSTRELVRWLRARQAEEGIAWVAPPRPDEEEKPTQESDRRAERRRLAEAMLARIPEDRAARELDADRWRITEVLSHLVEFHRREGKPVWWSLFDRDAMDDDEWIEDPTCLTDLVREPGGPVQIKRSIGFWYGYHPAQETKIGPGSNCCLAGALDVGCEVTEIDEDRGQALVKFGKKALARLGGHPPDRMTLLLHEWVNPAAIEDSIAATAAAWHGREEIRPALRDLLLRGPPRLRSRVAGALVREGEDPVAATVRIVGDLDDSVLCVQGPPGTGKTYAAARAIQALLSQGRRVGVASNSHKAVLNLLHECAKVTGAGFRCLKVGKEGDEDDVEFAARHPGTTLAESKKAAEIVREHRLVGGTAWFFSRDDVADTFDVLFVDEAGQVSLANLVGMAPCARSLVLLGDPMQLPQPTQGVHPGESGLSALDYVLRGYATVPADFGVFLPATRRLHPDVCRFVSGAFYEGRLFPREGLERRVVRRRAAATDDPVPFESGLVFVPVPHEGNTQRSDEEVEAVVRLLSSLVGREVTDLDGRPSGVLRIEDIVIVTPYNQQRRVLRSRLPQGARVGTVDKFQGQEARVSIVSLTASDPASAARGLDFVLDRRRLNVAISRAQSLAIVVGSPALARVRCTTVEAMRLLNGFCRIAQEGQTSRGGGT